MVFNVREHAVTASLMNLVTMSTGHVWTDVRQDSKVHFVIQVTFNLKHIFILFHSTKISNVW